MEIKFQHVNLETLKPYRSQNSEQPDFEGINYAPDSSASKCVLRVLPRNMPKAVWGFFVQQHEVKLVVGGLITFLR